MILTCDNIFLGLACIILAVVIYIMDLINPTATASFFNIDILTTFEDAVIVKTKEEPEGYDDKGVNGDAQELKPREKNANGEPKVEDGEEHYGNVEVDY